MSIADILDIAQSQGGKIVFLLAVLASLVEVTPIKINPLSAIVKWFGKNINSNVVNELAEVKKIQERVTDRLEHHITIDDERNADIHRYRILRFNTELIRGIKHTEEEFNEILYNMKEYKAYCDDHPKYENHRADLAMDNIDRVYMECAKNHDFL